MKFICLLLLAAGLLCGRGKPPQKIFDVHLHGEKDREAQLQALRQAGVYRAAISTSWEAQNHYRDQSAIPLLYGLMFPCPNGKVPYSLQPCYAGGKDWPTVDWVEQQLKEKRIDYLGEVLAQYYGISASDSLLYPYYALAEKYALPVGIHTGAAGPGHGSPNFKIEMGDPLLLEPLLQRFPKLRVWIMHSGGPPFVPQAIKLMQQYPNVYADVSVIANPAILPQPAFAGMMQSLVEAGLEDRLLFGSDNGDIGKMAAAINGLDFLSATQKDKIFYLNAERFFGPSGK